MNREDVLRMAREAGAASDYAWRASACDVREIFKLWPEELEQFAAAIRSATKEEDALLCEEIGRILAGRATPTPNETACAIRASK